MTTSRNFQTRMSKSRLWSKNTSTILRQRSPARKRHPGHLRISNDGETARGGVAMPARQTQGQTVTGNLQLSDCTRVAKTSRGSRRRLDWHRDINFAGHVWAGRSRGSLRGRRRDIGRSPIFNQPAKGTDVSAIRVHELGNFQFRQRFPSPIRGRQGQCQPQMWTHLIWTQPNGAGEIFLEIVRYSAVRRCPDTTPVQPDLLRGGCWN